MHYSFYGTYNVPTWALCYLANGDKDNLTEEDIRIIDEWLDYLPKGFIIDFGDGVFNQEFFTNCPSFGRCVKNPFGHGESSYEGCDCIEIAVSAPTDAKMEYFTLVAVENDNGKQILTIEENMSFEDKYSAESYAEWRFGYSNGYYVIPADEYELKIHNYKPR